MERSNGRKVVAELKITIEKNIPFIPRKPITLTLKETLLAMKKGESFSIPDNLNENTLRSAIREIKQQENTKQARFSVLKMGDGSGHRCYCNENNKNLSRV